MTCRNCGIDFVRKDGRQVYCTPKCRTDYDARVLSQTPERLAVRKAKDRRKNASRGDKYKKTYEERRDYLLQHRYGITSDDWDAMFEAQGRKCYFGCATPGANGGDRWATDHDHETGVVRAILCVRHNTLVGYVEKYGHELADMALYVEAHKPTVCNNLLRGNNV